MTLPNFYPKTNAKINLLQSQPPLPLLQILFFVEDFLSFSAFQISQVVVCQTNIITFSSFPYRIKETKISSNAAMFHNTITSPSHLKFSCQILLAKSQVVNKRSTVSMSSSPYGNPPPLHHLTLTSWKRFFLVGRWCITNC